MTVEALLGASPWIIFAGVFVYSAVHSLLASLKAKHFAASRLGKAGQRGYRLAYNLFAVISLLPVILLAVILPDRLLYTIPFPWLIASLLAQGAAVIMLATGLLQTGVGSFLGIRQLFEEDGSAGPSRLVVSGLYSRVRHPLYTAGLLFLWAFPVMTVNLAVLSASFSAYLVIGAVLEERRLLHEFGEDYARYRRDVPMLVPLPGLLTGRKQGRQ